MKIRNRSETAFESQLAPSLASTPAEILNVIALLADSLQHLETQSTRIDANQYDLLVSQLKNEMSRVEMNRDLRTLLSRYPAAGELFENMHYEYSGLCLHNNGDAVVAEKIAESIIETCSGSSI